MYQLVVAIFTRSTPLDILKLFKWVSIALFMTGGLMVSSSVTMSSTWYPYALFMVGHIIWVIAGASSRDSAILWLNIGYLSMDMYAIVVRF